MSGSKDSLISNSSVLAAMVGAFVFIIGYAFYQMSGHEPAKISGEVDQVQACVDKLRLRLNYQAEADFHVLDGSDISHGNIMIKFTTRNDSDENREYIVLCQNNGGVHVL